MRNRASVFAVPALASLCLAVATVAPAPASAAFGDRPLREGLEGRDVETLQRKLSALGFETAVDGTYGPGTTESVRAWESARELRVNGECSVRDAERIKRQLARQRNGGADTGAGEEPGPEASAAFGPEHAYGSRSMRSGDTGTDVAALQRLLTDQGLPTQVDGTFGAGTKTSVEKWEAWKYRRAEGVVPPGQAREIRNEASSGGTYVARRHVFPIRGWHSYGSSGSRFGAPRSGHRHQGQDMAAASGTPLVAAHDGTVSYRQYQAGGAGHYLVIRGTDGSDSVYMHMKRRAIVPPGDRVWAGELIGKVGSTGSSTGPHLHFELWTPHWFAGGHPYDPLRKLRRWDRST